MIYEPLNTTAPIRQGDIFRAIPRLDVSLRVLPVVDELAGQRTSTWEAERQVSDQRPLVVMATAHPVDAIVITQDCDTVRRPYLALCEIVPLSTVVPDGLPTNAKKRAKRIMKVSNENPRSFYLPLDPALAPFEERMAVDFSVILRLNREDLEGLVSRRFCRLGEEAYQHFRETLAQFLRRYPVDPWYPLDAEEFAALGDPDAVPRPHQRPATSAAPATPPAEE